MRYLLLSAIAVATMGASCRACNLTEPSGPSSTANISVAIADNFAVAVQVTVPGQASPITVQCASSSMPCNNTAPGTIFDCCASHVTINGVRAGDTLVFTGRGLDVQGNPYTAVAKCVFSGRFNLSDDEVIFFGPGEAPTCLF